MPSRIAGLGWPAPNLETVLYQPPAFREDRLEVQHGLIRACPLGLLVTAGPAGLLANPIPFLVDPAAAPLGLLQAHLARANPQLAELAQVEECLVVFQGPQAYVSPSWYASKQEHGRVVPTWNYVTVHAWGRPRVLDDAGWIAWQTDALTRAQEAAMPQPWAVEDAPADFVAAHRRAIVGLTVEITRIEGKWKVSQNRPEGDRRGVAEGIGGEMARVVAERGKA